MNPKLVNIQNLNKLKKIHNKEITFSGYTQHRASEY